MIEVPIKSRCAECYVSLDSVKARIEKHFEEIGKADQNAIAETSSEVDKAKPTKTRYKLVKRLDETGSLPVIVKQSARDRMLDFSRIIEERRKRKLEKKSIPSPAQPEPEEQFIESDSPKKEETAVVELRPPPEKEPAEASTVPKIPPRKVPFLLNYRLLESIQSKMDVKGISFGPLCSCRHGVDIMDADYCHHCCNNCPLYQDRKQHTRLLKTLLKSKNLI